LGSATKREADFSDRPVLSPTYALPVFNVDLASDRKLGYGFTSADELEEIEEVKREVRKMLDAGCIRPHRYTEWISNVILMKKKDGRWRITINDQDLNSATPKDE
jgi:hypothetical protein